MTNRELFYIKTIAEEKSISSAARKLFIAQPSLSQTVQRIESALGTKLFQRSSSGLKLTYAGERYYQMANQILRIYEDFKIEVSEINNLKSGRVSLGTTYHFGSQILPQILPAYQRHYPGIEVTVTEDTSNVLEQKLISGQLDFAIVHQLARPTSSSIHYDTFDYDHFVLTVPKNFPIGDAAKEVPGMPYPVLDIRALSELPLLTVHKAQRIRQITDHVFEHFSLCPRIGLELKNFSTVQLLAARGMGYTLGPLQYSVSPKCLAYEPQFYCLDPACHAGWYSCIATYKDAFLTRADEALTNLIRNYYASLHAEQNA